MNLANKEIVLTSEFTDNMPQADPSKTVIQNIMFVENRENGRYDPVIARYYPADEYSVSGFHEISYNKIGAGWSGTVDIWTYDERYFVGFIIEDGQLTATKHPEGYDFDQNARKIGLNGENLDTTCRHVVSITTVVTIVSAGGGSHISYENETSVHMVCSGGSLGNNLGSNGNTGTTYPFNSGGGGGGGGISAPNEQPYTPPKVVRPDFQIDFRGISDCHEKIIKDLIGSTQGEFRRIFQKFNGNQPVPANYNVRLRYGSCSNASANACTSPTLVNNWATITFNPNNLGNATDLSFARTVLHEMLHAYLLFEAAYPSNCDLNCLLNKYFDKYNTNNPSHHNLFAETKFLNDIAVELRNFATSSGYNIKLLGNQYFKDMAWGGLTRTDVFNSLSTSDKTRIINRLNAENTGDPKGNIVPKGIKACN